MARRTGWIWKAFLVGSLMAGLHLPTYAVDSVSIEFGSGNKTKMLRAAVQWRWQKHWGQPQGWHLGGYWDLNVAQWRGSRYKNTPGRSQDITSIGIIPVFRLQHGGMQGFYLEGGIGGHLLSELYDNNEHQLSTSFQFSEHLGVGYVFANKLDLGIKFQHFSNGSIKKPNDGVNLALVRLSFPF